jgi:predicted extracellular nuclease
MPGPDWPGRPIPDKNQVAPDSPNSWDGANSSQYTVGTLDRAGSLALSRRVSTQVTLLFLLAGCSGDTNTVHPSPRNDPLTTAIADIQGSGSATPMDGQPVVIVGIVSGDFQDSDADARANLGGFYVQSENPDTDPATSNGVFVFDGNTPVTDVSVGDEVNVEGTVTEYFGETQIIATDVRITGTGAVQATVITLPAAATLTNSDGGFIADLERYEGMLLQIPQTLFIADLYNLERYGSLQLVMDNRAYSYTNSNQPDVDGFEANSREHAKALIHLDDGLSVQNASPVRYLYPDPLNRPGYSIRAGDTITGLTGNLRFSRGSGGRGSETYRIVPTTAPQFISANPRPDAPPAIGGSLRVASFNVLNFFTTVDSGQNICGPAGSSGCRGANSVAEFDRQRSKTVSALALLDADVVGLMELENNSTASLQSLVDGLNQHAGATEWAFVDTGTVGSDAVKLGFIFKIATATPVGLPAILDSTVDARFIDSSNRPVVAQTFDLISNNGRLTIAVNHLKSKGSDCDAIGDPDFLDGQGNCNLTRTSATVALADWLATDPTGSGDIDFLIIGDLNAYLQEDPVATLEAAGYHNLLESGLASDAYSYLFRGRIGALDHALASAALAAQVSGVSEWHINADEPPLFDYNLEFGRDSALFDDSSPYRTSDHDPVVIGIELVAD